MSSRNKGGDSVINWHKSVPHQGIFFFFNKLTGIESVISAAPADE